MSRLTENDAGLVSIQHAVVCVNEHKIAHKDIVQQKKISNKFRKDVHKKQSTQSKKPRNVVKSTAQGELKMNKKNWKLKSEKFVFNFIANTIMVIMLNAGMSAAP